MSHYWALGRDFAWLIGGVLLLGILIFLAEYAALPAVAAVPLAILRLLLGLVTVLFVPGYCLTALFFPQKKTLDGIERSALSVGLSIAWVAFLALILDRLPWGLQLWTIYLAELLSILLFTIVALWQRARTPVGEASVPQLDWRPAPWWRSLAAYEKIIYVLLVCILLMAGLILARGLLVPSPDEFTTGFYILGEEGLAENYPTEARVGEPVAVTMGIHNSEREAQTYRVEVWVRGETDQRELLNTAGPITLDPRQSVEQPVSWTMPWSGEDQLVEFYLYADGQEGQQPYRALRLWVNVHEGVQEEPQGIQEDLQELQIVPYGP